MRRMKTLALALATVAIACRLEPPQREPAQPTAGDAAAPAGTPATAPTTTPTPTATPPTTATIPMSAPRSPAPSPAALPPPPSAAVLLRTAVSVEPAGRVPLVETETVIDPAATFELELGARCPDARLLLLDQQDALVAGTSTQDLGATTKLTLAPAAPLRPGSRYVLRVDGAATRELHDAYGRAFGPVSRPLLVAGTPPPPEPKKPARRRRR